MQKDDILNQTFCVIRILNIQNKLYKKKKTKQNPSLVLLHCRSKESVSLYCYTPSEILNTSQIPLFLIAQSPARGMSLS